MMLIWEGNKGDEIKMGDLRRCQMKSVAIIDADDDIRR